MKPGRKTGRKSYVYTTTFSLRFAASYASVATISALLQAPAFFSSCVKAPSPVETQIYIQSTKNAITQPVDLFFFDTEGPMNLDSYQEIHVAGTSPLYGVSGAGDKHIVALSGLVSTWLDIRTYGSLCKRTFSLENDSPEAPLLVAETRVGDAASRRVGLQLHPMLSCIRIRSVSCSFSGRPYAGDTFHNNKLFLSYAGTECFPVGTGDRLPVSWVNAGPLDSMDCARFPHPDMLMQEGLGTLSEKKKTPDRRFYCYPHPDTRLVLGGTVGDRPCYYPIPLPGLEPGKSYTLDIAIHRMGSPDPDIPAESGAMDLQISAAPWYPGEQQTVKF